MARRYIFRCEVQTFRVDVDMLVSIVKEDNDIIKCLYSEGKEFHLYCDDEQHQKKTFDELSAMMVELSKHEA